MDADDGQRAQEIARLNEQFKKETEKRLLDKIYFWVIDRYTRNKNEFTFSDRFIWKGTIYLVPETLSYVLFIALFLTLAHIGFEKYGEARTVVFFMLLLMWRLQAIIKQLAQLNKKFQ